MSSRKWIAMAMCAVAAMALPATAQAHNSGKQHRHITPTKALSAVGDEAPGCDVSLLERHKWGFRKADEVTAVKDRASIPRVMWTYTRLCAGEDVTIGGEVIRAPKAAGTPIDASIDIPANTVAIPEGRRKASGSSLARRGPTARNHGSCTNTALVPWYSGGLIYGTGYISCSGSVPLRWTNLDLLRKYNSTGNVVVHAAFGSWCCHTSTSLQGAFNYGSCPAGSTYATRWGGQRYHDGAWGGDPVTQGWSNPTGCT